MLLWASVLAERLSVRWTLDSGTLGCGNLQKVYAIVH